MYAYEHIYIYVYLEVCIYIRVYIYIYIYIYTYIYIYIWILWGVPIYIFYKYIVFNYRKFDKGPERPHGSQRLVDKVRTGTKGQIFILCKNMYGCIYVDV
jgi:hypothetical protein